MNERVVLLTYTGFKERLDPMLRELARVGLSADIRFDFPSVDRDILQAAVGGYTRDGVRYPGLFYVTLNHYRAIKETLLRGYDSVMVLEDDIRFMRDLAVVEKYVSQLPSSWDALMYDYFCSSWQHPARGRDSGAWHRPEAYHSAGCYRLSRRGMERMVYWYEKGMRENTLRICDHYFADWAWRDLVFLAPRVPLAVQVQCPGGGNFGPKRDDGGFARRYGKLGISKDDYMEF